MVLGIAIILANVIIGCGTQDEQIEKSAISKFNLILRILVLQGESL